MSKPEELILDDCVFESFEFKTKDVKTATNQKFKKNLEKVRKVISINNQQYINSQLKVADLIIKGLGPASPDDDIAQLRSIAKQLATDKIDKDVLDVVLLASMEKLPYKKLNVQEIDLHNGVDNVKSKKLYNVKFNLKKCWTILYQSYDCGVCLASGQLFGFILTVIKLLAEIFKLQTIDLTTSEAIVLSTLLSYNGHATFDQIKMRIEDSDLLECIYDDDKFILPDSLNKLTTIKTIDLISGEYVIIEDVFI